MARIQRMPLGGRWALGLGLAFAAGLTWWALLAWNNGVLVAVVMVVLALAAGVVLSIWWAAAPLAVAAIAGAWVVTQLVNPMTTGEGTQGDFVWFLVLAALPFLVLVLIGAAIGKWLGRQPWWP